MRSCAASSPFAASSNPSLKPPHQSDTVDGIARQVSAVLDDGSIEELDQPVLYDPFTWDDPSALTELWRRLRIQFSIGEAF